jgi:hypothetical protein
MDQGSYPSRTDASNHPSPRIVMFSRSVTGLCRRTLAASSPRARMPKPPEIGQQARKAYVYFESPPRPRSRYQHFQGRRKPVTVLWKNPRFRCRCLSNLGKRLPSDCSHRRFVYTTALAGAAFVAYNTEEVPVSGRRRFNCISPKTEAMFAKQM